VFECEVEPGSAAAGDFGRPSGPVALGKRQKRGTGSCHRQDFHRAGSFFKGAAGCFSGNAVSHRQRFVWERQYKIGRRLRSEQEDCTLNRVVIFCSADQYIPTAGSVAEKRCVFGELTGFQSNWQRRAVPWRRKVLS